MIKYVRLCIGLVDKGVLVPFDNLFDHIEDENKDHYRSVYNYSEAQFTDFQKTGSIAGVSDVVGNMLVWDFDSNDLEKSRQDTITLVSRLITHGLAQDSFTVAYSGNKGFSVEAFVTLDLTPKQHKNLAQELSSGLETADSKVYNANRIFRIPNTRHNVSGLFKVPLTVNELSTLSIEEIQELAKEPRYDLYQPTFVDLPKTLEALTIASERTPSYESGIPPADLDLSAKPKWMAPCKFAILNGHFKAGNRNHALMALGATIKSQGFPKEVTYRMLKGAAELQSKRTNTEAFSKDEIWNNIIEVIYSPTWKGATYACKDHKFLQEICPVKGTSQCGVFKKESLVTIDTVSHDFRKYATDIDKNTVKTGIVSIDKQIRLQTHSHVVMAGCSGSGKTTLLLNILNNASNAGLKAVFGSMDMGKPLIYQKLAQKTTGYNDTQLYHIYKHRMEKEMMEIDSKIHQNYKNVLFDFRSGVDFEDLRTNLMQAKDRYGDELKLAVYDFINRIRGPYSDELSNLNYIAPRLADLANETETLVISLSQTARAKGGPGTPLLDSRVSKGSSAIEESATALFGIWRPGYNMGSDDKYMCIAALKTRMGKEFVESLKFNGLTGEIRDMSADEQRVYEHFVDSLEEEKEASKKNDGWGNF